MVPARNGRRIWNTGKKDVCSYVQILAYSHLSKEDEWR